MAEWKWIDTLTRQFELCDATNGRDVVVVGSTQTPAELIDTALIALQRTGARGSLLVLASSRAGGNQKMPPSVQAALRTAELVIDCTDEGLPVLADTDMLVLGSRSPAGLEDHTPHPGLKERVRLAEKLLRDSTQAVVTSVAGTDLDISSSDNGGGLTKQADIAGNWGCPRPERRRAQWPGGNVTTTLPDFNASSGRVVLMPGDLNLTLGEVIHSPVTIDIESGRISEIIGESGDADLLRAYLESFDDLNAYLLLQCTIGLNPAATAQSPFTTSSEQRTPLAAGQISLGFGKTTEDPAAEGEPLLVLGLRSATLDLGAAVPVRNGILHGEIAPDVYESAATQKRQR